MTRKDFLKGASATLLLGGLRLFAVPPGWRPDKKPNLVFGVISDTHLNADMEGKPCYDPWRHLKVKGGALRYVRSALEYFRDSEVDAVLHCGDIGERGQIAEMQFLADTWRNVFGKGRLPGGRKVDKLFILGNHDMEGGWRARKLIPDEELRNRRIIASDVARSWEDVWGECYEPVWHKVVRGYHFFGQHWEAQDGNRLASLVADSAGECGLDGTTKPFFLVSHAPSSVVNEALRPYRNAVGFFGHYHESASSWKVIRFYTMSQPWIQTPASTLGGENILPSGVSGNESAGASRQGYIVRVYDDMLAIERREFGEGGKLGADWVLPFENLNPHPFTKGELEKVIGEPQFPAKAKLVVKKCIASVVVEDTASADTNRKKKAKKVPAVKVSIPLADGNPGSRVYAYEVGVTGDDPNKKLLKAVYAAGCNMGIGHEPNGGMTTLEIPKSELPSGKTLTVDARPLSSLGTSGNAIEATFKA